MDDDWVPEGCLESLWELLLDFIIYIILPRTIWGWLFWLAILAIIGAIFFL